MVADDKDESLETHIQMQLAQATGAAFDKARAELSAKPHEMQALKAQVEHQKLELQRLGEKEARLLRTEAELGAVAREQSRQQTELEEVNMLVYSCSTVLSGLFCLSLFAYVSCLLLTVWSAVGS